MKSLRVRETGGFFAEGPWKIEGHSAEGMRSVARLPALRNQKTSVGRWRSVSETESFVERFSTALHKKTDVALEADAVTSHAPGTEPKLLFRTTEPRTLDNAKIAPGRGQARPLYSLRLPPLCGWSSKPEPPQHPSPHNPIALMQGTATAGTGQLFQNGHLLR